MLRRWVPSSSEEGCDEKTIITIALVLALFSLVDAGEEKNTGFSALAEHLRDKAPQCLEGYAHALAYAYYATNQKWWCGMAVFNTEETSNSMSIVVFDEKGTLGGKRVLQPAGLGPKGGPE